MYTLQTPSHFLLCPFPHWSLYCHGTKLSRNLGGPVIPRWRPKHLLSLLFSGAGCVAILWCAVWLTCVTECPADDDRITAEELKYIIDSIGPVGKKNKSKKKKPKKPRFFCLIFDFLLLANFSHYPWRDMLTSMPVWSVTCAHFCENWGFYTLLTQLPSYMNGVYFLTAILIREPRVSWDVPLP